LMTFLADLPISYLVTEGLRFLMVIKITDCADNKDRVFSNAGLIGFLMYQWTFFS
jgi:hypothetical protein